jgi:hypothetical protein
MRALAQSLSTASSAEIAVEFVFRGKVNSASLVRAGVNPEVSDFPVYADVGLKSIWSIAPQLRKPSMINIHVIFGMRALAQIGERVVGFVAVDMIDKFDWPPSVEMQPCKPVTKIRATFDRNGPIAVLALRARHVADLRAIGYPNAPNKMPGLWIVIQDFAEMLYGDVRDERMLCLHESLLGSPIKSSGQTVRNAIAYGARVKVISDGVMPHRQTQAGPISTDVIGGQ